MNPLLLTDFYKVHHNKMYPEGMTKLYSNFTPRKSRIPGVDKVVFFGLQHFILEYLIKQFNEQFFHTEWREAIKDQKYVAGLSKQEALTYKKIKILNNYYKHVPVIAGKTLGALWDLGYLPIEIKAVPEGTQVPIGVPCFTITNTHPDFAWLTNYLETLISCMMWQPITSATIAYEYKKLLTKFALETTGSKDFVQWQGHDFSMRGMSSVESAILSGMGHLLSFTGTDTIPAIYSLETSYEGKGLIGASVPATEHSVMCMGEKEAEVETFKRLLKLYPTGILSVVSDTWDLWKVLTEYLPAIKDQILARDGKLVIRPDSGDPVDILCGKDSIKDPETQRKLWNTNSKISDVEYKGVIELLWDTFGGTTNKYGYKELDSHIGAIYGDSITLDRAKAICERLKAKGFASTNVVLGIGSYTYQYNTRDTFGFAMKATYGEVKRVDVNKANDYDKKLITEGKIQELHSIHHLNIPEVCYMESREIFKDPITDDGTKKSKKGLLLVGYEEDGTMSVRDQQTWKQENKGLLQTVFLNGKLTKTVTLQEIRERLKI